MITVVNGRARVERTRALASIVLLVLFLPLCGCMSRDLQSGLSEQDAQKIVILLKKNGLDAYIVRETGGDHDASPAWRVRVKGGSRNLVVAWQVMHESGLPPTQVQGCEVFSGKGIIPTATEEKVRMLCALSGKLTGIIKSVSGVVHAHVQVALPENSPLLDKAQWNPPTASVLITHQGSVPPLTEDEVRRLVAGGVEGLKPENVAVVYKTIPATPPQDRNIGWYLSDAYVVAGSVVLAMLTMAASISLVFRNQQQKATIASLQRELETVMSQRQLAEASRG